MEKYTIKTRSYTRNKITESGEFMQMYVVEINCDTAADIPSVAPWWDIGSACFIVDTQEVKFLNSNGEWE